MMQKANAKLSKSCGGSHSAKWLRGKPADRIQFWSAQRETAQPSLHVLTDELFGYYHWEKRSESHCWWFEETSVKTHRQPERQLEYYRHVCMKAHLIFPATEVGVIKGVTSVCEFCSICILRPSHLQQNTAVPDNIVMPRYKFMCAHLLNIVCSPPISLSA